MLGTLRFTLAWIVAAGHLEKTLWNGTYAVFSFYIISGYLMCLVMNQRYGFTLTGLRFYLINRFLRIYPPYWVACGVSVLLLAFLNTESVHIVWSVWRWPESLMAWVSNLSLVGLLPFYVNPLVPPAWTLWVEVFYYVAIALVLGRNRAIAVTWFFASVAYHVYLGYANEGVTAWAARYFTIEAASLPFSLGALIYHFRQPIVAAVWRPVPILAFVTALWVSSYLYSAFTSTGFSAFGLYLNCGISAVLVVVLIALPEQSTRLRRVDSWLGDLSYPVYLMHMQIGALTVALLGLVEWTRFIFIASAPLLLLTAWLMAVFIDRPLEGLRDRVKASMSGLKAARPS